MKSEKAVTTQMTETTIATTMTSLARRLRSLQLPRKRRRKRNLWRLANANVGARRRINRLPNRPICKPPLPPHLSTLPSPTTPLSDFSLTSLVAFNTCSEPSSSSHSSAIPAILITRHPMPTIIILDRSSSLWVLARANIRRSQLFPGSRPSRHRICKSSSLSS